MNTVLFFVFLLIWCVLFALLEAQIEGENGWAAAQATARYHWDPIEKKLTYRALGQEMWLVVDKTTLWHRFIIRHIGMLGGKDWTWYHRVVDFIQIYIAHLLVYLFFLYTTHPLWLEVRAFGSLFLIWTIEDTLWFYVNPLAYKSNHHKEWVKIGNVQLMEKGMFGGFIIDIILSFFSFGQYFWHLLAPYLHQLW